MAPLTHTRGSWDVQGGLCVALGGKVPGGHSLLATRLHPWLKDAERGLSGDVILLRRPCLGKELCRCFSPTDLAAWGVPTGLVCASVLVLTVCARVRGRAQEALEQRAAVSGACLSA